MISSVIIRIGRRRGFVVIGNRGDMGIIDSNAVIAP